MRQKAKEKLHRILQLISCVKKLNINIVETMNQKVKILKLIKHNKFKNNYKYTKDDLLMNSLLFAYPQRKVHVKIYKGSMFKPVLIKNRIILKIMLYPFMSCHCDTMAKNNK